MHPLTAAVRRLGVASTAPELIPVSGSDAALAEFDTEDELSRAQDVAAARPAVEPRVARTPQGRRTVTTLAIVSVSVVLIAMGTRREPPLPSTSRPAAPRPPQAARPTLSGSWRLTSHVVETSVPRFRGLILGYELRLEQDGDRLRGVGVKATENGRALSSRARTPIALDGVIDGETLHLAFTESGLARTSRGAFSLRLTEDRSLAGGFWSDAARSSGTVTALRRN